VHVRACVRVRVCVCVNARAALVLFTREYVRTDTSIYVHVYIGPTYTYVYIRASPCTPISGSVSSLRVAISIRDLTCERDFFSTACNIIFSSSEDFDAFSKNFLARQSTTTHFATPKFSMMDFDESLVDFFI